MGIIDRLSTMLRSNLNDLISRAENPEKMLNQLVLDMRSQLAKAKQQVASAIADEKRLQAQAEQEKKLAEDWVKRAMLAVQEGRDDLAKQALPGELDELRERLDRMQHQLSELAERQDFAERLLAQVRKERQLPGAADVAG